MKTLEELLAVKAKLAPQMKLRTLHDKDTTVIVSMGEKGLAAGADKILCRLSELVLTNDIDHVTVIQSGVKDYGVPDPVVEVKSASGGSTVYSAVDMEMAEKIVKEHLVGGNPVKSLS